MTLNVNRAVQDSFYRYKMPRLMAKVEGKGNGVKTVIPNMVEIARALGRPPTYCCKYFGCELGAQTQFDFKNERYIVNGAHDAAKLQDMLDGFIKKFVLCEKCDNPETVLKAYIKKGIITASCKACGHSFTLDMRHKLTTYIIRNPPEQAPNVQGTSLTGKKDKRSVRREQEQGKDGDDDDDFKNEDDDGEEKWSTDTSEAARKDRMKGLTSGVKGLAMDDDMEKPESERINIFHDFLQAKVTGGLVSNAQSVKEVFVEAERLEVSNKAVLVLCEVLLGADEKVIAKIEAHKLMFLRFTNENQKAQKYLLGGIEKTVEAMKDALLPKVPLIFKAFYDHDILDEEVIVEWSKKVSKKHVPKELAEKIHKNAAPFVTWLMEAEEEEDSDDDSDVELEFNERAREDVLKEVKDEPQKNGKKEATPPKANAAADAAESSSPNAAATSDKKQDEDEDDLDIDDI